jgi:site-specific DNA-methyltransferase (adenine-specific)
LNVQTNFYNKQDVYKLIGKYYNKIQQIFIWEKSNPMPAQGYSITNAYEYFLVFGNKALKSNYTYTKNILTTSVNSSTTTKIHKAVMKQEVADWFIRNFTVDNDIVLDPFMGLGTTGISCKKYNRDFIGIEKNKQYYDIAMGRIKKEELTLLGNA